LETFAQHPDHKELRNKWKKLGNVFKRFTNPTHNNKGKQFKNS
jgi:O-acetylhomoserine/O-acetylserine sulfhydrylase-like pyridoxal-dependent enzyme